MHNLFYINLFHKKRCEYLKYIIIVVQKPIRIFYYDRKLRTHSEFHWLKQFKAIIVTSGIVRVKNDNFLKIYIIASNLFLLVSGIFQHILCFIGLYKNFMSSTLKNITKHGEIWILTHNI